MKQRRQIVPLKVALLCKNVTFHWPSAGSASTLWTLLAGGDDTDVHMLMTSRGWGGGGIWSEPTWGGVTQGWKWDAGVGKICNGWMTDDGEVSKMGREKKSVEKCILVCERRKYCMICQDLSAIFFQMDVIVWIWYFFSKSLISTTWLLQLMTPWVNHIPSLEIFS